MPRANAFEIQFESDLALSPGSPQFQELMQAIEEMHRVVPCQTFEFNRSAGDPALHSYEIVLADGRRWNQTLRFAPDRISMTFTVSDEWTLEEFVPHRAVRDAVIHLQRGFGLSKVEARWGWPA